jgi:hypothetical protein
MIAKNLLDPRVCTERPATRANRFGRTRVLLLGAITLALTGCEMAVPLLDAIAQDRHTLEVTNLCGGPNLTVDVYLNGTFAGSVYYRERFPVSNGPLTMTAVGTGPLGTTFRGRTTVRGNLT